MILLTFGYTNLSSTRATSILCSVDLTSAPPVMFSLLLQEQHMRYLKKPGDVSNFTWKTKDEIIPFAWGGGWGGSSQLGPNQYIDI